MVTVGRDLRDLEEAPAVVGLRRRQARQGVIPLGYSEFRGAGEAFTIEARVPLIGTLITPEGHEVLTRSAAAGLSGLDLGTLIEGVRRVDTGNPMKHFMEGEQRRHVLRRYLCQPLAQALAESRAHLASLHRRMLGASSTREASEWMGEALHLIQDSYSPAHTERAWGGRGGVHPILFIRYYGVRGQRYPLEHRVVPLPDPRDIITASGVTHWAAESVRASREYLQMALRHRSSAGSPMVPGELSAFMNRHLLLSPARTEPSQFYRCP